MDYWWFYLGFTTFVLTMLLLDLGVFHKKAHAVSIKESTTTGCKFLNLLVLLQFEPKRAAHGPR